MKSQRSKMNKGTPIVARASVSVATLVLQQTLQRYVGTITNPFLQRPSIERLVTSLTVMEDLSVSLSFILPLHILFQHPRLQPIKA
jgi:hypothetical protein